MLYWIRELNRWVSADGVTHEEYERIRFTADRSAFVKALVPRHRPPGREFLERLHRRPR